MAKTLQEHNAALAAEGKLAAIEKKRRARKAARLELEKYYYEVQHPLLAALAAADVRVNSAWDLVNRPNDYDRALPILLEHLDRDYPDRVLEGIARALAVPGARPFWTSLKDRYHRAAFGSDIKRGLAVALAAITDKSVLEELIELARDASNGPTRIYFIRPIAKSKSLMAARALCELEKDDELACEVKARTERRTR